MYVYTSLEEKTLLRIFLFLIKNKEDLKSINQFEIALENTTKLKTNTQKENDNYDRQV